MCTTHYFRQHNGLCHSHLCGWCCRTVQKLAADTIHDISRLPWNASQTPSWIKGEEREGRRGKEREGPSPTMSEVR